MASAWAGWLIARVDPDAAPVPEPADGEGIVSRTLGGLRAVRGQRDLRLLFVLIGVQTFMRGAITVLTVVVAVELVGMGEAGVGTRLNAAVGRRCRARVGHGRAPRREQAAGSVVRARRHPLGRPLVLIGLVPSPASALLMLALVGAGNALIDVAGFTLIARLAPANVLARVFGVLESLVALTVGIGGS